MPPDPGHCPVDLSIIEDLILDPDILDWRDDDLVDFANDMFDFIERETAKDPQDGGGVDGRKTTTTAQATRILAAARGLRDYVVHGVSSVTDAVGQAKSFMPSPSHGGGDPLSAAEDIPPQEVGPRRHERGNDGTLMQPSTRGYTTTSDAATQSESSFYASQGSERTSLDENMDLTASPSKLPPLDLSIPVPFRISHDTT
ncbi:hypothetical protein BXZ70DRAFT_158721 [Cristinia sonorae]|uniref:Uncharacterized protein n=1 Tax=Cristinia sonorae TaxID=1940300 RepID=A0A8K0UNE7_9AGAR|nr:hypothetical protein BXZ70DRAFT_158721 [Cristinia sonorae]